RMLSSRGPSLVLEPLLVHIAPGGRREPAYGHAGEEFAYVLSGELLFEVDGVEHRLYPGDSVHLRSTVPHAMYNDTDEVTTGVAGVTPRRFSPGVRGDQGSGQRARRRVRASQLAPLDPPVPVLAPIARRTIVRWRVRQRVKPSERSVSASASSHRSSPGPCSV